ncbi:hypothetical protein E2C01_094944 [Portunus trituberculatus]|uniref:Uncharacterized protein n=1 Tax=Portunus trituberculatus TaxID=210409 RepID=A0A5B7JY90_PORTR|nr:hypothetical protein [Portunus trituberculatus]
MAMRLGLEGRVLQTSADRSDGPVASFDHFARRSKAGQVWAAAGIDRLHLWKWTHTAKRDLGRTF